MIAQLTNPTYAYQKGGAASVSCTLNLLADDGVTVLATTSLQYTADLTRPDFRELMTASLSQQAQEYIDQLKVVAGLIFSQFGAVDFGTAAGMVLTDVDSRIEV